MWAWWIGTTLLGLLRAAYLYDMASRGLSPVSFAYLLVEGSALAFGAVNLARCKAKDCSWRATYVSSAYLAGSLLLPSYTGTSAVGVVVLTLSVALSSWALFSLRTRFTFGPTSWIGLCDWGPYRYIRHPQQAARILFLVGVAYSGVSVYGLASLLACGYLAYMVTWWEEAFIAQEGDYFDYILRVPWRIIPWVA
jgi:protein-S-isoprenylcysteine O-methyltransferase Ste14